MGSLKVSDGLIPFSVGNGLPKKTVIAERACVCYNSVFPCHMIYD